MANYPLAFAWAPSLFESAASLPSAQKSGRQELLTARNSSNHSGQRVCESGSCAAACGAAVAASLATSRKGRKSGQCRAALPKDFSQLPPEEAARVAAQERAALRLGDLPEEERQLIVQGSDLLGPFRPIVQGFGAVALAGALYDFTFQSLRSLGRSVSRVDVPESVATGNAESLIFTVFLFVTGVALLYTGTVLMEPDPVPTMQEVLDNIDVKEVPAEPEWSLLEGEWCYGDGGRQRYRIKQEKKRVWRYDEELNGQSFTARMTPKGGWLQGRLLDAKRTPVGAVRVRPGEGRTSVSYFMELGGLTWENKNIATAREDQDDAKPDMAS